MCEFFADEYDGAKEEAKMRAKCAAVLKQLKKEIEGRLHTLKGLKLEDQIEPVRGRWTQMLAMVDTASNSH